MPRKYIRKPGSRAYKNYTPETLQEALRQIRAKNLSIRDAAERYGIHRNTLFLKLHGRHGLPAGGQTALNYEEEQSVIAHIIAVSTFGFPVTAHDLRFIVKTYLDKRGKKVKSFRDNLPGNEWVTSFLDRHKNVLANRIARNISISRAAVDHDVLNQFFDNLENELEGVVPANLWNYDETNLGDDPGSTRVLMKRGTKYPEQIRNATKACTSLMIAGNASGELAPVYIVYKSEKLWQTWTENGPEHARYNRTKSGWFDYQCFEDWFVNLMLPILKKQEGKKVLIGDNLSSHLNIEVIRQCEANNISFIALPPNATHLVQPLDVAFFRPMKGNWRQILHEWKDTVYGSRCGTIPKDQFPALLKKLMNIMQERAVEVLPAGFRKCGLHPLNRAEVLSRLPAEIMNNQGAAVKDALGESFLEQLQRKRDTTTALRQRQKRRRVNVAPGKSISAADLVADVLTINSPKSQTRRHKHKEPATRKKVAPNNEVQNIPSTSSTEPSTSAQSNEPSTSRQSGKPSLKSNQMLRLRRCQSDSESSEDSDAVSYRESGSSPMSEFDDMSTGEIPETRSVVNDDIQLKVGNYVIICYEGTFFPGVVTLLKEHEACVSAMEKCGVNWKWPDRKDELFYEFSDIVQNKINKPVQISTRREIFRVLEMELFVT